MYKMMSKLAGAGAVAALLFSAHPTSAQFWNSCSDWCDGQFELGAHALVFTPVACQYDFATQSAVPVGQSFPIASVKCELDWGFRIFGNYEMDCVFLGVSYQWFESNSSKTVIGLNTVRNISNVVAAKAQGALRFEYQNLDVAFGKYLHRSCGCNFFVFGNVRWVDLSLNRNTRAVTNTGVALSANEKGSLDGAALGLGLGGEVDLWCDIGLFGSANLLGVIAERSTKQVYAPAGGAAAPLNTTTVSYSSDTCITPEANFRIGANYTYQCGCWSFIGEIGYEVDYFWNAVSLPRGAVTTATNRFRTCEDIGFSGLFFGGRVLF